MKDEQLALARIYIYIYIDGIAYGWLSTYVGNPQCCNNICSYLLVLMKWDIYSILSSSSSSSSPVIDLKINKSHELINVFLKNGDQRRKCDN